MEHTEYACCVSMSVKHGLLALLERGSRYGYELRAEFEEATGGIWPLNIGQVYTTLARLERDGLVRALPESNGGQRPYEITGDGKVELALWFAAPISQTDRPRDELAIKLALALTTPGVDVRAVVRTQRTATMRMLQEYTRLKNGAGPADLAWRLVLDAMVFRAEAEVRWLDHCEASIARFAGQPKPSPEREGNDTPGTHNPASRGPGAHSPRTTVHDADTDDITREATAR
jgi:DNA-binding PadR family transcriptional regulator